MIILGENRDDKGTQLELLTKKILETKGYKNITKSNIGPGGEEIDVTGEFIIPSPNTKIKKKLICECKAHNTVNNMNDWLKFLGKVYMEEAIKNQEILGCFIALTGVNGNVQGCYESLGKDNISLITGDELYNICESLYNICKLEEVDYKVKKYTNRQNRMSEIIYYDDSCYWLVVYENYDYTILSSDGQIITAIKLEKLNQLLGNCNNLALHNYIDLEEEAKSRFEKIQNQGMILCKIIENEGKILISDIKFEHKNLSDEEMQIAINELKDKGFINQVDEEVSFIEEEQDEFYLRLIEILKFIFNSNGMLDTVIGCKYYDEHINNRLLEEVKKIQGNLELSDEEGAKIIELLKLSPTALIQSLYPQGLIVNHRKDNEGIDRRINESDKNYYFRMIYKCIKDDFTNKYLNRYFGEVRKIREIESDEEIKIKTEERIIHQDTLNERIGIGKLSDDLGGIFTNILIMQDAGEPWELYNKNEETEKDE